jgi:hypothetical protein
VAGWVCVAGGRAGQVEWWRLGSSSHRWVRLAGCCATACCLLTCSLPLACPCPAPAPAPALPPFAAPHPRHAKESACGCAGLFSAPVALALYAHAFEQAGALAHFEAFASFNGPDFYGLPRNTGGAGWACWACSLAGRLRCVAGASCLLGQPLRAAAAHCTGA